MNELVVSLFAALWFAALVFGLTRKTLAMKAAVLCPVGYVATVVIWKALT